MCKLGKCFLRRVTLEPSGFICINCEKFISDEVVKRHPRRYEKHRFNAKIYGGPIDGKELRLPFAVNRFWIDAAHTEMYHYIEDNGMRMHNLYEYEIESYAGDFIFVKIRPANVLRNGNKSEGEE